MKSLTIDYVPLTRYQKLEAFVTELLVMLRDGIDGADVQDLAIKHEVLKPVTVYESCGESCQCAQVYDDIEEGVTCYKLNFEVKP